MSNQKRRIANVCFLILSILATVLSLAGYLGRANLYLEFVSGYKLQFLLMALCSLFYFSFARHRIGLIVCLFCICLNLAEILPWYFNQPKIANVESYEPLKIFSYNVLWNNKQYDKAISLIQKKQPDIVAFQEAQAPWSKALTKLKTDYPYHIGASKLEIEVYSKFPLTNQKIELYGTYRGLVISDIKIGNNLVKVVATHAYPQLYFGHEGWEIRNQHLEVGIGEYVSNLEQSVVIIGDLNVTMWSPFYRSLINKSSLQNARQGFGILPSQSVINPSYASLSAPIDHCLVSQDIKVAKFNTEQNIGSDHLPITADLLIPQKSSGYIK